MKYRIGIDPGLSGAMVAMTFDAVTVVGWKQMPVSAKTHGQGKQVDAYAVADWLAQWDGDIETMCIERVSARPGQGVSGMFSFGRSVGVIEGVCATMGWPITWVLPTAWKRAAGILKAEKDAARTVCLDLYPEMRSALQKKASIGIADATLIARHGG